MADDKQATYEDANLILKLYELRREETMRTARTWYITQFFPESVEDILALFAPGHPHNAHLRMVVTYWDMAASFAVRGPLSAELLLESATELLLVWAKIEKFIAGIRESARLPEYLRNLEAIVQQVEWAPARIEWLHQRFALFRAQTAQAKEQ
jgi:hypothetical protein